MNVNFQSKLSSHSCCSSSSSKFGVFTFNRNLKKSAKMGVKQTIKNSKNYKNNLKFGFKQKSLNLKTKQTRKPAYKFINYFDVKKLKNIYSNLNKYSSKHLQNSKNLSKSSSKKIAKVIKIKNHFKTNKTAIRANIDYKDLNFKDNFNINDTSYDNIVLHEHNNFIVKIANHKETKKFLKLRSSIFGKEYRKNMLIKTKDQDYYDQHAMQIILYNNDTDKIIAGCRLIISDNPQDYYSNIEYDISKFMQLAGKKIEISRVCVHPKHRNGSTIVMLWRGILKFSVKQNIDYLFGMPTIKSTYYEDMLTFFNYCQKKGYVSEILAKPRKNYLHYDHRINEDNKDRQESCQDSNFLPDNISKTVTPLMMIFLKAGAKLCSSGGVEHDLQCIDFFTVLKTTDLQPKYKKFIKPS